MAELRAAPRRPLLLRASNSTTRTSPREDLDGLLCCARGGCQHALARSPSGGWWPTECDRYTSSVGFRISWRTCAARILSRSVWSSSTTTTLTFQLVNASASHPLPRAYAAESSSANARMSSAPGRLRASVTSLKASSATFFCWPALSFPVGRRSRREPTRPQRPRQPARAHRCRM